MVNNSYPEKPQAKGTAIPNCQEKQQKGTQKDIHKQNNARINT